MRRPVVALVAGVAVLVVLALPALGMHTKQTGLDDISRKAFPVLKTYDHIQESFPSENSPAVVVIQAPDVRSAQVQAGIAKLERQALATGQVLGPIPAPEISRDGTVAHVDLPLVGDGSNGQSMDALATVREPRPRRRSAACRARPSTSAATPRRPRTATTTSRRTRRSCSASCSRWRSCCCSSRSGRS